LDLALAREKGIHVARRITGGGAVYHDLGNLNYTYISTRSGGEGIDFATFSAPVVEALGALGVDVTLSGRNDLLVCCKKISGNAQYSRGGRVLHHGTLLYDTDFSVLSSVLRVDPEKLSAKAIRSVSARVMNLCTVLPLSGGVDELSERLLDAMMKKRGGEQCEAPENEEIHALAARNASEEWILPNRPYLSEFSVVGKKRYSFGTVELTAEMQGERVKELRLRGDFFGCEPISELEERLRGAGLAELPFRLRDISVDKYIYGMTAEDLIALLTEIIWR
jgi:lipoate-protein ligase A